MPSAMKIFQSFFSHADVTAFALIAGNMVPSCAEAAWKFKPLRDPERASAWYEISVRNPQLLYGNFVASFRAGEVATRHPSVDEYTSRYREGLARQKMASPMMTVAVTSSWRSRLQIDVAIMRPESGSDSLAVLGEMQWKK